MSDLIVIQPQVTELTITEDVNQVVVSSVGVQGPKGDTGATGPTGPSGVVSVTAPITNSGTSTSANIGVSAGSTSTPGVLQLTDSVSSTSTTTAATPNAVKTAYDAVLSSFLPFASGFYYKNPGSWVNGMPAVQNRTYYFPFFVPVATTFDRIFIKTATNFSAGTNTVRLGIYASTGNAPSTLILDAGTVSATTVSQSLQITINQTLAAGVYFVAANNQSAAANNFYGYQQVVTQFSLGIPMNTTNNQASAYFIENSITGAFANASSPTIADANGGPIPLLRAA